MKIEEANDIQQREQKELIHCMLFCSLAMSVLMVVFFDYAAIVSSSIIGSYLSIRGLSLAVGGYPNEILIYNSLVDNKFFSQNSSLFLYLLVMIVLATVTTMHNIALRKENLELYSYKRYDFRYRRADILRNQEEQGDDSLYKPLSENDEEEHASSKNYSQN